MDLTPGIWLGSRLTKTLAMAVAMFGFAGMSPAMPAFAAAVSQPDRSNADSIETSTCRPGGPGRPKGLTGVRLIWLNNQTTFG